MNEDEKPVDLLEGFVPAPGRRVGNTTRLVDKAIQLLYEGKIVQIKDHHEEGNNPHCNKTLMYRIYKRLASEHNFGNPPFRRHFLAVEKTPLIARLIPVTKDLEVPDTETE